MFKKTTGKSISIPAGIGLGVLVSTLISIAGAAVMAYFLSNEMIDLDAIGWVAMGLLIAASFAGALTGSALTKVGRLPVSLGVGGGFLLVLLAATALFFGGQYQGVVTTAIMTMLGSGCAGLIGLRGKKPAFRIKKIPAYR